MVTNTHCVTEWGQESSQRVHLNKAKIKAEFLCVWQKLIWKLKRLGYFLLDKSVVYKILQLGMIGFRDHPIKQIFIYILFTTNSSGAEPTLADKTVDMKACVTVGKSGACSCDMEIDIQVRNCSSYLVYNLSSTPSCPQRYCFGI